MNDILLDIRGLSIFTRKCGPELPLVQDVHLPLRKGTICALVGDSGSGKSLIAAAIAGILAENLGCAGEIRYKGTDLLSLPERQRNQVRGRQIGIVMQDCAGSLNPLVKNGKHLSMVVKAHPAPGRNVREACNALLRQVHLEAPELVMKQYPHQLSGGMKQRLMMAMGLAGQPDFLILDEPTKGLDIGLRNQTMEMIAALHREMGITLLLITHDLELAYALSDACCVLEKGRVAAHGETHALFDRAEDSAFSRLLTAERRMNAFFPHTAPRR